MSEINPTAKIKCQVNMGATVVRGPNSEYGPPGSTEELDFGENKTQVVELTYEQCVNLIGKEMADDLFRGYVEGGDFVE